MYVLMSSAEIDWMFATGPRMVRAKGVPTYAHSWSISKMTSSVIDSTSSISRRMTSRSRSTAACENVEFVRMSLSSSTARGTSFFSTFA